MVGRLSGWTPSAHRSGTWLSVGNTSGVRIVKSIPALGANEPVSWPSVPAERGVSGSGSDTHHTSRCCPALVPCGGVWRACQMRQMAWCPAGASERQAVSRCQGSPSPRPSSPANSDVLIIIWPLSVFLSFFLLLFLSLSVAPCSCIHSEA